MERIALPALWGVMWGELWEVMWGVMWGVLLRVLCARSTVGSVVCGE